MKLFPLCGRCGFAREKILKLSQYRWQRLVENRCDKRRHCLGRSNADEPVRMTVLTDQRLYYSAPIVTGRPWVEIYSPGGPFTGF